jgi:hypothetical protein
MTEIGIVGVLLAAIVGTVVTWRRLGPASESTRDANTNARNARFGHGKFHLQRPVDLHLRICVSLLSGLFPAALLGLYLKYFVGI